MEFASGVVSVFPGPGTASSVAMDLAILANEIIGAVNMEL